jgi:hypothetical protein
MSAQTQQNFQNNHRTSVSAVAGRSSIKNFTSRSTNGALSLALIFGLSVTVFMALVQMFDPTLDEHIHLIKQQQEQFFKNTQRQQQQQTIPRINQYNDQLNPFLSHHNVSHININRRKRGRRQKNNNSVRQDQETNVTDAETVRYVSLDSTLREKDRIYDLLSQAGIIFLPEDQLSAMPKWDDVSLSRCFPFSFFKLIRWNVDG